MRPLAVPLTRLPLRMPNLLDTERRLWADGYTRIAGIDEAGRGCLAGPVVAAAVILPPNAAFPGIQDSKALSATERNEARALIEAEALAIGVGMCSPQEIDDINILWAAMKAMRRAMAACDPAPDYLLVDGNRCFDAPPHPHETLVKGDAHSQSIAAASIIAKTTRDRFMRRLHDEHPHYGWDTNVGYPTRAHYEGLATHGPTLYHRHSFKLSRS